MGDIYILMLVALTVLAIIDLVVGVSNDAVNFLNSAIGSKAIPIKWILIIASAGVAIGAITSSGMMEVARKGIFNPSEFYFDEIMYIFMAVMITDILLLDIFNSLGMPTSTTVSIVFELLGAAVAMALIKISNNDSETLASLGKYINSEKALLIISGILLSVFIAFTIGALVQFISRLIYSFHFEKRKSYVNALFGGFAITAITYFIFVKGLKGTPFYGSIKHLIEGRTYEIIIYGFVFWTLLSQVLIALFKVNILKVIIVIGTFSLAMAFAGNDLVNFVGVLIAAWNSYQEWTISGVAASEFSMGVLAQKVPSNPWLLFIAGMIMVVTLWFSKKAKSVIETGINLSRQGDGHEKFQPNVVSRTVVRGAILVSDGVSKIIPSSTLKWVDTKFQKPVVSLPKDKSYELPAFDMVRASVNLFVAGILISIGTSLKLPLSTTYVTFMVAMGTSLADRAWGRESAVYRVAGVFNVIGGWFLTALSAFVVAAVFAYIIYLGGIVSVAILLILVLFLLGRSSVRHTKKAKEKKEKRYMERAELITINEVITESSDHIAEVVKRVNKLFTNVVEDLAAHDLNKLSKTDKHVKKLNVEVNELKEDVFYFIKSLDEASVKASRFYILVLGYLQDITQSIEYISTTSYKHVNNNHKNLKASSISDLKEINEKLKKLFGQIEKDFTDRNFSNLNEIIDAKQEIFDHVSESIDKQIARVRTEESSPKNSTLYFGILLETKDLIAALMSLLQLYQEFQINDSKK
ncbi:inorganic phosphate transporter [Lutibacter sp. HS1-25]|uniref:inorganic phosphate transporter n=1 Tax=Lutibacter sp. HS1-25 TaxID=2485000 RepID=UPI0010128531|nr:inorganic phosphate transporter [Lutibacter sp. HS1-25]RXP54297.1 inorganic phosphate transporter [Lutibacter sp. HS1-25]